MAENRSLPTLTGANFPNWKTKIIGYCMQHRICPYLTHNAPPEDSPHNPTHVEKGVKLCGILYQCIGQVNHQWFVNTANTHEPALICKLLIGYYKSNSVQNQSIVYNDFLDLAYRNSTSDFLDKLDGHLSRLSAVGLTIGNPQGADLKDSLLVEYLLRNKSFDAAKANLFGKRVMIAVFKEALETSVGRTAWLALLGKPSRTKQPTRFKNEDLESGPPALPGGITQKPSTECRPKKLPKDRPRAAVAEVPLKEEEIKSLSTTSSGMVCVREARAAIQDNDLCFLNSGASHHMFSKRSIFSQFSARKTFVQLTGGNKLESIGEAFV